MKNLQEVPGEILNFFLLKENQILLVKGGPGTGKTTLALKILKTFADPRCGIYYTTKINTKKIYNRYPWIKNVLSPENIIDITKTPNALLSTVEGKREAVQYSFLPGFLRYLHFVIEEIKLKGQPFLVVDNFHSLCKSLETSLERTAKELIDFIQESNVKAVIVSEQTNEILESMVEGIVEMMYTFLEGRIFRKMLLKKLLGVEIKNPIYHFTLINSNFTYFPVVDLGDVLKSVLKKPIYLKGKPLLGEMIDRSGISPEIPILLIELETSSAREISYILQALMVAILLGKGYSGIITPMRREDAAKFLTPHTDMAKKFLNNVRFLYPRIRGENDEKSQSFITTIQENINELKKENKVPVFLILRYDLLRKILGDETAGRIVKEITLSNMVKSDVCIVITSKSDKIEIEELKMSSSAIIKVFEEHGRIFCYEEKPYTQIFGILFQEKENHIEINLTPMV